MVQQHYGLVVSQALRFTNRYSSALEDYIQVGLIGLLKAIRKYNPEKAKFSTFAVTCIRNEICRFLNKKNKTKLVNFVEEKAYSDENPLWEIHPDGLTEQEKEIIEMKFQNYTHQEIAEATGCSKNRIRYLIKQTMNKLKEANGEEKEDSTL